MTAAGRRCRVAASSSRRAAAASARAGFHSDTFQAAANPPAAPRPDHDQPHPGSRRGRRGADTDPDRRRPRITFDGPFRPSPLRVTANGPVGERRHRPVPVPSTIPARGRLRASGRRRSPPIAAGSRRDEGVAAPPPIPAPSASIRPGIEQSCIGSQTNRKADQRHLVALRRIRPT